MNGDYIFTNMNEIHDIFMPQLIIRKTTFLRIFYMIDTVIIEANFGRCNEIGAYSPFTYKKKNHCTENICTMMCTLIANFV